MPKFGNRSLSRYSDIFSIFLNIQKIVRCPARDQIIDLKARLVEGLAVGDDEILYQTAIALAITGRVP
ncbi:MAG: hypothetical protein VYC58_10005 [Pseudomonadota bacterium]|nr:hypothetical protein [Pseudomonadota bacterium]